MLGRNTALAVTALGIAFTVLPVDATPKPHQPTAPVIIRMVQSADGSQVGFDPVGVHIQPGQTVRWTQIANFHSVAAYHPANDHHELRIPTGTLSWDSGMLTGLPGKPDASFVHRFVQEGVYDYFCSPHEQAGMVGRIIVGRPLTGPGTQPFNYAPAKGWHAVPLAAQQGFPAIAAIMAKGAVHRPFR